MSTENQQEIAIFDEVKPPLTIKIRAKDGKLREYEVRESEQGEGYWQWEQRLNDLAAKRAADPKSVTTTEWGTLEVDLLCQSLYQNGKLVERDQIIKWGESVRGEIFKLAFKQNGFDAKDRENLAKNSESEPPSGGGSNLLSDLAAPSVNAVSVSVQPSL